jgi:hypothetical protein
MAKLRCVRCPAKAGSRDAYCQDCGTALPGRVPTVTKAAGARPAVPALAAGVPWRELMHSDDPALREVAWGQVHGGALAVTKAARAAGTAAVMRWRDLLYDNDPAVRVMAWDQVSEGGR